jgi:rhodanese-related sulfurtransferase
LVVVGPIAGLVWNGFSGRGIALTQNVFIEEGDALIEAAAAKVELDNGALFLDARPRPFYEMEHIPGSLPLPEDDFAAAFAELEPRLRDELSVIVYCSGYGCEASHIVARKLQERGVAARILHEGWPAWLDLGYPTKQGAAP